MAALGLACVNRNVVGLTNVGPCTSIKQGDEALNPLGAGASLISLQQACTNGDALLMHVCLIPWD